MLHLLRLCDCNPIASDVTGASIMNRLKVILLSCMLVSFLAQGLASGEGLEGFASW